MDDKEFKEYIKQEVNALVPPDRELDHATMLKVTAVTEHEFKREQRDGAKKLSTQGKNKIKTLIDKFSKPKGVHDDKARGGENPNAVSNSTK